MFSEFMIKPESKPFRSVFRSGFDRKPIYMDLQAYIRINFL